LTFCSTVNAISHAGAQPVLADVDPVTMNVDPREIEVRITARTRAIIPVHLAGRPCDMEAVGLLAARHGLRVIEDCAHAIEAESAGRPAGTFGDFGCFSFYATKNVTTAEGGMVLARRPEELETIRMLASNGLGKDAWRRFEQNGYEPYSAVGLGFKFNMTDLQAAIGIHQLRRVMDNWRRRQAIWSRYLDALAGFPLILPGSAAPGMRHACHLFTVLIDESLAGITRDEFVTRMTGAGIGVGVHYLSLPEHPAYRERFGWRPEDWPVAMRLGRQTVSLPLGPGLTDHDVERVVGAAGRALGHR
jgi:dTDP-4-amino-4,6-dideoxygalactose transaminase